MTMMTTKNQTASDTPAEVIVQEACILRALGASSLQHVDIGAVLKLDAQEARHVVVACGRALYLHAADDRSRDKRYTALKEDRDRIACLARAAADRDRLVVERSGAGERQAFNADAIAAAVARGVAEAMDPRGSRTNRLL